MSKYTSRVSAGIALLNKEVPGWRNMLDVDALDVGSDHNCVLGQLFAGSDGLHGYTAGCEALRLNATNYPRSVLTQASVYGFNLAYDDIADFATAEVEWTALQQEWERQLSSDE